MRVNQEDVIFLWDRG